MTAAPPALVAAGTVALDRATVALDVTVHPGQVVGLVGPNGAGKSVTLRTLLGLLRLRDGEIRLDGRPVDDGTHVVPPHLRGLGWVSQAPDLLPRRRALAQVTAFARDDAPLSAAGPAALLRDLDLDPEDRRPPHRLSGGQAQRVAIARALAAARTVLLDEPLSAQDGASATRIRALVRRHAAAGGAVLLVAHRPEDAYAIADELVVLEAGQVVQRGAPSALAAAPVTPYVAHVVGATVLEGEVDADGALSGLWGQLAVPDGTPPGPAVAVIRPSSVVVATEPPSPTSSRNLVTGTVRGLRDTTEGILVTIDAHPPLVAAVTHRAATALALAPGRRVWASVKANEIDVHPR